MQYYVFFRYGLKFFFVNMDEVSNWMLLGNFYDVDGFNELFQIWLFNLCS